MEIEKKNKLAFLQIRRHVGEINWILPIIFTLKKKITKLFHILTLMKHLID